MLRKAAYFHWRLFFLNLKSMNNQIGKHLTFETKLSGHPLTLSVGPGFMESFSEKMGGIPAQEVAKRINGGDWDTISTAPDNMMICAIQAGSKSKGDPPPSEADIRQWITEDPWAKVHILIAITQAIASLYQFTSKTN
jgi:hypothetical protein